MGARDLVRQSPNWGGGGCQLDIMKLTVIIMTLVMKTGGGGCQLDIMKTKNDNHDPHDEDGE